MLVGLIQLEVGSVMLEVAGSLASEAVMPVRLSTPLPSASVPSWVAQATFPVNNEVGDTAAIATMNKRTAGGCVLCLVEAGPTLEEPLFGGCHPETFGRPLPCGKSTGSERAFDILR